MCVAITGIVVFSMVSTFWNRTFVVFCINSKEKVLLISNFTYT
jgi:hypothetical protein